MTIHSSELVNTDFKNFTRLDSVSSYKLLENNPEVFNWSQTLFALELVKPEGYLSSNKEVEKRKAIKEYLQNNYLYKYPFSVKGENYNGILIRSISKPSEWMEKDFSLNLFLIGIKKPLQKPLLLNTYYHSMGVASWEKKSITKIYSDQSIEVLIKSNDCSDALTINNTSSCDSTVINHNYEINSTNKGVKVTSDTTKYNYEI